MEVDYYLKKSDRSCYFWKKSLYRNCFLWFRLQLENELMSFSRFFLLFLLFFVSLALVSVLQNSSLVYSKRGEII